MVPVVHAHTPRAAERRRWLGEASNLLFLAAAAAANPCDDNGRSEHSAYATSPVVYLVPYGSRHADAII
jgi:hypothetical protein